MCVCVCKAYTKQIIMQIVFHNEPIAHLFKSDHTNFHLNGFINQQNCRYSTRKSKTSPWDMSLFTLCGAWFPDVVLSDPGSIFFKENGMAVTVLWLIHQQLFSATTAKVGLRKFYMVSTRLAAAQIVRNSPNLLQGLFPDCLISRFGDMPWVPWFPNLIICDFFGGGVFHMLIISVH